MDLARPRHCQAADLDMLRTKQTLCTDGNQEIQLKALENAKKKIVGELRLFVGLFFQSNIELSHFKGTFLELKCYCRAYDFI